MNGLTIETLHVGEVPTLLALPFGAKGCPVVFCVPGYGGTKKPA